MINYLFVYVLCVNLIGFYVMYEDKRRAKLGIYRISENTLWLVAIAGGAVGTTAGMRSFRHKTKHPSFKIGFPFLAIVELAIVIYVLVVYL